MGTKFSDVYNRFLGKITDDMYIELTPQDTLRDLQNLLIQAIPQFEFCKKVLTNYVIQTATILEEDVEDKDFVIGVVWNELPELDTPQQVLIEQSYFEEELTPEEMEILAILMMIGWVQRQVTSIEHTRMKYSGSDFKMTSQANHLQKLLALLAECQRQSTHAQRLYNRRRLSDNGLYESNWDVFNYGVYY